MHVTNLPTVPSQAVASNHSRLVESLLSSELYGPRGWSGRASFNYFINCRSRICISWLMIERKTFAAMVKTKPLALRLVMTTSSSPRPTRTPTSLRKSNSVEPLSIRATSLRACTTTSQSLSWVRNKAYFSLGTHYRVHKWLHNCICWGRWNYNWLNALWKWFFEWKSDMLHIYIKIT